MTIRERAEHILGIEDRYQRAAALEELPEPLQSHVRDMVAVALVRRQWAKGEA